MPAASLYDELATIADPRGTQGLVHPLPAVLGLVVLALLMGRKSLKGVARFGRQHGTPLAHALGFRRGQTPSGSTLSRTLRRLDAKQLEVILSRWIAARTQDADIWHVSLDGKTLRGSRDGDIPGQHLVAAYAPCVEAVLAQVRVDAKTNEHKAALELLGILPVAGKVIVGDAMFCQRDLAAKVIEGRGDYLLVVKDNQSGVAIDIEAGFGFEHAARAIAAATSPSRHSSGRYPSDATESGGHIGGQGSRTRRETNGGSDANSHGSPAVEGTQTGLANNSRANRQG
jgi:predicted transposase YbfD/YdcC